MKHWTIIVLLFTLFLSCVLTTEGASPGLYTAINSQGVTNLANKLLPGIFAKLSGSSFPDVVDGHHHIVNIHLPSVGMESFVLDFADDETINLDVNRFFCELTLKYRYKRKIGSVSVNADVRIGDAYFHLKLRLTNADGKFALAVAHVAVDAGEANFKLHGNILAKLLNALKSLFNSRIKKEMLGQIRDMTAQTLHAFANDFAGKIPTRIAISDWGSIDFSLINAIKYTASNLIVGFSGDIQDAAAPAPSADVERHEITFNPTERLFSIGIDTFVFNTGFNTFFKGLKFNHVCTKDKPNGYSGMELTTTKWGQAVKALQKQYPDSDMRIVLRFGAAPILNSKGGQIEFNAMIHAAIDVHFGGEWVNAFTLGLDFKAKATVAIIEHKVFPQLTDLSNSLSVISSNIGDFDTGIDIIQDLVNFAQEIAVVVINEKLIVGIPLPVNDQMVISNADVTLPENAIVLGADIDFNL